MQTIVLERSNKVVSTNTWNTKRTFLVVNTVRYICSYALGDSIQSSALLDLVIIAVTSNRIERNIPMNDQTYKKLRRYLKIYTTCRDAIEESKSRS